MQSGYTVKRYSEVPKTITLPRDRIFQLRFCRSLMWIRSTSVFHMSFVPLPVTLSSLMSSNIIAPGANIVLGWLHLSPETVISRYPLEWQAFFFETLWWTNIAMENGHLYWIFPLKDGDFPWQNVSSPEGNDPGTPYWNRETHGAIVTLIASRQFESSWRLMALPVTRRSVFGMVLGYHTTSWWSQTWWMLVAIDVGYYRGW